MNIEVDISDDQPNVNFSVIKCAHLCGDVVSYIHAVCTTLSLVGACRVAMETTTPKHRDLDMDLRREPGTFNRNINSQCSLQCLLPDLILLSVGPVILLNQLGEISFPGGLDVACQALLYLFCVSAVTAPLVTIASDVYLQCEVNNDSQKRKVNYKYGIVFSWVVALLANSTIFATPGLAYFATQSYCLLYDPLSIPETIYAIIVLGYLLPIAYLIWVLLNNFFQLITHTYLDSSRYLFGYFFTSKGPVTRKLLFIHIIMWSPFIMELYFISIGDWNCYFINKENRLISYGMLLGSSLFKVLYSISFNIRIV